MNLAPVSPTFLEQPSAPGLNISVGPSYEKSVFEFGLGNTVEHDGFSVDEVMLLPYESFKLTDNFETQSPNQEIFRVGFQDSIHAFLRPSIGFPRATLSAHLTVILNEERLIQPDTRRRENTERFAIQDDGFTSNLVDVFQ
jgi:hypothetical protein